MHLLEQSRKEAFKISGQCQSWMGDSTPFQASITDAVNDDASRYVFVGGVEHSQTEEIEDWYAAGKLIAFIHFTDITSAVKAVTAIPNETKYGTEHINYGKDHCARYTAIKDSPSSLLPGITNPITRFVSATNINTNTNTRTYIGISTSESMSTSTVSLNVMFTAGNRIVFLRNIRTQR